MEKNYQESYSPRVNSAALVNTLNSRAFSLGNKGYNLCRSDFINTYSQDVIDACWNSLSINVIQNYQRGKGTSIKGFGTFTFKNSNINLEGTTNQNIRDKKPKLPVFIVSKELCERFCAGEYTRQNGIRYYNQKESKNIPIVKLNLAEMAYSLSMSKEEVGNLIKHLMIHLRDCIIDKTFRNKILPGLGVLVNRNNILAVKFNDELIKEILYKNEKLVFTKKNISLDNDFNTAKNVMANECLTPFDNIEKLKATNALNTLFEKSGKNYAKFNYGIDIHDETKYPEHEIKSINNPNYKRSFEFINDSKRPKSTVMNNITNIKNEDNYEKNPLNILDEKTLKTLEYYKGILIKNCKNYDYLRNGRISKGDIISALVQSNINNKIDYNTAKKIVEGYIKTEDAEYMKFIAILIKDSRYLLLKKNNNNINNIKYDSLKREKFFYPNKRGIKDFNTTKAGNYNPHNSRNFSFNKKNNFLKNQSYSYLKAEEEKNPSMFNPNQTADLNDLNTNPHLINPLFKSANNFFTNRQKETEDCRKKLSTISTILPELKRKYLISLEQKMSYEEFMNVLRIYDILYPKQVIISLLNFLEISDINAFSLKELDMRIKACKILQAEITTDKLNEIMKKLRDVIYINGGEKFLFNNEINPSNTLDCDMFIKILGDKVPYEEDILINVFSYLVKTDRKFNKNDYIKYFENPETKINYNETYFLRMMEKIIDLISRKHFQAQEFFDYLVLNNFSTYDKVITRLNWIKYLQKENLGFSAEELDNLFNWIDTKKDNVIDNEEFLNKYKHTLKPLTDLQNIVRDNKLDIEDLAHHMGVPISEILEYDFETFKQKMRTLNYTYPDYYMLSIFNDIKNKNKVNSKKFLDEINYVKPAENYKSFTQNYMNLVKRRITHDKFKNVFEKLDNDGLGVLSKLDYVKAVANIIPEFNDEDHMRFLRITNMFNNSGEVKYPEVLNLIFFYNNDKLNDKFMKLCHILSNLLNNECKNDVESLMYLIEKGSTKKANIIGIHKPLTPEQIKIFINKKDIDIPIYIIQKLDVDSDGLISFEDLTSVLKRYIHTSFFKYTNDSSNPEINFYSKENMSLEKFGNIAKRLKDYMKQKNISEIGLFKKFDKNNDGFISCIDFNSTIGSIIPLPPAMRDQFFNYLDYYKNGLIDLETFISRLNNFSKTDILVHNNNIIENQILQEFKNFVIKNKNLSDNEIFAAMDKDCDGIININDLRKFLVKDLMISEKEFSKAKLERVMMSLSLSKNFQIGLNDIREFINLCNENKEHINLKEVFKLTANQNLSHEKKNKDWTNDIIERLGMFISEKYDSIEQFFEEAVKEKNRNKFKFEDFVRFHERNYELFNNGFNLTKDELLSIFTSLDSQKKDYLTLEDLKNKLQIFNFYNKMHIDVKNFINENFKNGLDAFKFFIRKKNILDDDSILRDKYSITLKEFFDTFENFFPNKYTTNTILRYIKKYFRISVSNNKNDLMNKKDSIHFQEFNYIYFDAFQSNESFVNNKINDTKLMTNREEISSRTKNDLINSPQNNFYYSNLFKKKFSKLITPFDNDPLNKIKRIICSSKYDLKKFFDTAELLCGKGNYIVNKYQFRNIIKELNIGLTNLEIDQIMFKCGKESHDGNINLKEFIKYLYSQNSVIDEGKKNLGVILGEIKSLIYKYYSNPIICFENNDTFHNGKIDFDRYKNIIYDMYNREEKELPNFTLIKNSFDAIDIRKDGIIDRNEWCRAFASYNGKLDFKKENVSNGFEFFDKKNNKLNNSQKISKISHNRKILRDWETSGDVSYIYKFINRNRKLIREKIAKCNFILCGDGVQLIHADNLINVLKETIPGLKLSQTQWKMIVNLAQNERTDGLININDFFKILEITSNNMASHPIMTKKTRKIPLFQEYSGFNTNKVGYKTMTNGFFNDRRSNSINKDKENFNLLSLKYANPDDFRLPFSKKRGKSNYKTTGMSAII